MRMPLLFELSLPNRHLKFEASTASIPAFQRCAKMLLLIEQLKFCENSAISNSLHWEEILICDFTNLLPKYRYNFNDYSYESSVFIRNGLQTLAFCSYS